MSGIGKGGRHGGDLVGSCVPFTLDGGELVGEGLDSVAQLCALGAKCAQFDLCARKVGSGGNFGAGGAAVPATGKVIEGGDGGGQVAMQKVVGVIIGQLVVPVDTCDGEDGGDECVESVEEVGGHTCGATGEGEGGLSGGIGG